MVQFSFLSASTLLFGAVAASSVVQPPKQAAVLGVFTPQGCWKDPALGKAEFDWQKSFKANNLSSEGCGSRCLNAKRAVFGMAGERCFCAKKYPHVDNLVDDAECNFACKNNATEACGNKKRTRFSVWNTGIKLEVENSEKKKGTTTTASSTTATSTHKKATKKAATPTSSSLSETTSESETTASDSTEASTTAEPTTSSGIMTTSSTAPTQTSSPGSGVAKNVVSAGVAYIAFGTALFLL